MSLCICGVLLITCSSVGVCKEHSLLHLGTNLVLVFFLFFPFLKGFCEIRCLHRSQGCLRVSCMSLTSSKVPVSGGYSC